MRLPFIGTALGGALFYDGGNVYSRLSRISFREMLPPPTFALQNPALPPSATNVPMCVTNCSNELNYFSHTLGLGFRYKTPVGPIRIDLGYQLNRPIFVIPIPCPSTSATCQQGSLGQQGIKRDTLKIGDVVTITINPSRTPADHRGALKTLHRKSDGFGWGTNPGETID